MDPFSINEGHYTNPNDTSDRSRMHSQSISDATATSIGTNSVTGTSSTITLAVTHATSPIITASPPISEPNYHRQSNPTMTVYYRYDGNGKLLSTSMDEPLTQSSHDHIDLSYYEDRGDKVGAFLAQRDWMYPAYAIPPAYGHGALGEEPAYEPLSDAYSGSPEAVPCHQAAENNDSCFPLLQVSRYPDNKNAFHYTGSAAHPSQYPDPEDIRHLHTLHSILPYIQPQRKLYSLTGQTMDIVEQDTGTVLAYHVPKKLLVLFLGRKTVTKFLRTVEREDNENWRGKPVVQELRIPRLVGSRAAFRVLVSWMIRACQYHTMGRMRQFRVPQNTLTACTLAQVLDLFGLHKDAFRVDSAIAKEHFARPIFPVELEALWNCVGEDNRYLCAAIQVVGQRLQVYEIGSTRQHPMWEEMLQLLEEYPPLRDRVRDLELNERHRPAFGREWYRNLDTPHDSMKRAYAHHIRGSVDRSWGGNSGSSVAPEQGMTSTQPRIPETQTRKAAVLRIVA